MLADNLVGAITDVQGISCLPFNRTLAAMQQLGLSRITNSAEAQMLANALGADGIVVGSITSYNAYTPELGVALALFAKPGAMRTRGENWSPKELRTATTDQPTVAAISSAPLAQVHERFDAKNNQVLMDVQAFADGREKQQSAMGWRRYLASMDLFSQFAMYRATDALVQQEWVRLARASVPKTQPVE
jgi:curli biogenesis system outer membrane secretion channel CsgG